MNKLYGILLGLSMMIFGVIVIFDPIHYDSKFGHTFDFSEIRWPFGLFLFGFGILAFIKSLAKSSDAQEQYRKCPKCLKTTSIKDLTDIECPDCLVNTEPLKGFFKRHPEHIKEGNT